MLMLWLIGGCPCGLLAFLFYEGLSIASESQCMQQALQIIKVRWSVIS